MGEVILTMKDIDKSFPGVHALDHVNFEVKRGEVHALMGENGAGKSTLMKVLTGIYQKDSGTITYKGKETEFHNTREAQDAGVVIVHQELNMIGDLTVAQNIFIGREPKKGIRVDDKKMIEDSKKLFQDLNIEIDPREKMSNLTVGKQQMCEIAKAISHKAEVIIFDEPSAALTEKEIADLFEIIKDLRKKNLGIVYISHRMDEIMTLSDRVSIMRDGHVITTLNTAETTQKEIITLMVGRELGTEFPPRTTQAGDVALEVRHLCTGKVKDVSFTLRKGEILGFAGLVGSGRTEIVRAIFGADKIDSGEIYINGKKVDIHKPAQAIAMGIGMIPEDRKRQGVHLDQPIKSNMTLLRQKDISSFFTVSPRKERQLANEYIQSLSIKLGSIDHMVSSLSGGNQQKIVLTKWLAAQPDIIFFDEPTRGIDVGAKAEIYVLMDKLRQQGKAIILISSEMEEVLGMSDRIIVLAEHRMTGELTKEQFNADTIMAYASAIADQKEVS